MSVSTSKTDRERANAENRRVEIIPGANFEYIIEPVLTRDTVIESSLDRISIRHRTKTGADIKSWSAKLIEGVEILSQF
ncbi:MAG: hypothetical protein PF588_05575 [Candidatus Kapabacteria bacterium]|jgi:hypothetical protein|nr:hypothetical protein [Candidatus Kapabacteria bacterium]